MIGIRAQLNWRKNMKMSFRFSIQTMGMWLWVCDQISGAPRRIGRVIGFKDFKSSCFWTANGEWGGELFSYFPQYATEVLISCWAPPPHIYSSQVPIPFFFWPNWSIHIEEIPRKCWLNPINHTLICIIYNCYNHH